MRRFNMFIIAGNSCKMALTCRRGTAAPPFRGCEAREGSHPLLRTQTAQGGPAIHKIAVVGKSIMQIDNRWIDAHRITI